MAREIKKWITVNGRHVPIYDGETAEDAINRSIKVGDKEVTVNKKPITSKKRVDQKDLTNQKIMDEIAGKDSYANNEEYQKLSKQAAENFELQDEIDEKVKALEKELEKESEAKPESEWTDEDEITALIFGKKSVKRYTEKGDEINKEIGSLKDQKKEASEKWKEATDKMKDIGATERLIQKKAFDTRDDKGEISTELQKDYEGFSKDKTTTPYIDDALEKGDAFVVEMTPKRYIEECAYNIFSRENSTIESTIRGRSAKDVAKYMTMMEEGVKFNTPYLNYRDEQQEGLHRAIAAYMLGLEKIPVVVLPKRRR